jgi:hypothetical protein
MSCSRSAGQNRVVRPRRRPDPACAALADIDKRVLAVLCAHRVVRQDQLARLFPEVPERTLRYRTRRLHDLGLAGRSRPYREQGSAPNHHWPTRRADCLMRGDPVPRGGERKQPNPIFLAHATALTEFYVTLTTRISEIGLAVQEYRREAEAREPFTHIGKERALAPDAMVILVDPDEQKLGAFVEIDLGTMSHARLRQKAELYTVYAESNAWHGHHLFLPALLFLTTTDIRAAKFLKALAGMLSHGRGQGRRPFVAGGAGVAWAPHRLLSSPCLADLDGHNGLALIDVLNAARAPYEEALAYRREREEAEDTKRQRLRKHPEEMREFLAEHVHALGPYLRSLGELGEQTLGLLLRSTDEAASDERAALAAIARDLGEALPELSPATIPDPGAAVISEVGLLAEHYRARQCEQVKALTERHGNTPSLLRAWGGLRDGGLLDHTALARLQGEAEQDAASRVEQRERAAAYEQWREKAARGLVREGGPLGRLTRRQEDFYDQLDRETLKVCRGCRQLVYPPAKNPDSYDRPRGRCHYCHDDYGVDPYRPANNSKEAQQ